MDIISSKIYINSEVWCKHGNLSIQTFKNHITCWGLNLSAHSSQTWQCYIVYSVLKYIAFTSFYRVLEYQLFHKSGCEMLVFWLTDLSKSFHRIYFYCWIGNYIAHLFNVNKIYQNHQFRCIWKKISKRVLHGNQLCAVPTCLDSLSYNIWWILVVSSVGLWSN